MNNFVFSCGIMENLNGYKLKSHEPDSNGFFPMVIGVIGDFPTRAGVIYDGPTLLAAMQDTSARFNICLRDGNLNGEYGHPVVETQEDIPRLLRIDEKYKSHYFGKIWTDEPLRINGSEAIPIKALVKPSGPYGDALEKEFRDPCYNNSFSIRSLCLPCGEKNGCEYRKVQMLVTFDAVHAPGFAVTSKRYVGGAESFKDIGITKKDLVSAITTSKRIGMESACMLTRRDIDKMYSDSEYTLNGNTIAKEIIGKRTYVDANGHIKNAASLMYERRR